MKKAVIVSSFSQPLLIINHFLSYKSIIPVYTSAVVSPTTTAPIGPSPNTMTKGPASTGESLGSYIAINYVFLKKLVSFVVKRQTVSAIIIFSCHCCVLYDRLWRRKKLSSDVQANRYSRAGVRKKGSVAKNLPSLDCKTVVF